MVKKFVSCQNNFSRKFLVFVLMTAMFICAGSFLTLAEDSGTIIKMNNANIEYLGRWEVRDDGSCTGYFQSAFRFSFTGTSLSLTLENKPELVVKIDEGSLEVKKPDGAGKLTLANKSLSNGVHTADIFIRRKDSFPVFKNIILDSGAEIKSPAKKPTIEFIGDSITEGWVGNGYGNGVEETYAFLTGEKLGFSHNNIANSGITLVPGNGEFDRTGMSTRYFKLSEHGTNDSDKRAWDTSKYVPDNIVINIGTNDLSSNVPATTFYNTYVEFLTKLRASYPKTAIFLMCPLGGQYSKEIPRVVENMKNKGDSHIILVESANWITSAQTSDGLHPTPKGHAAVADKLKAVILAYINKTPLTSSQQATSSQKSNSQQANPSSQQTKISSQQGSSAAADGAGTESTSNQGLTSTSDDSSKRASSSLTLNRTTTKRQLKWFVWLLIPLFLIVVAATIIMVLKYKSEYTKDKND